MLSINIIFIHNIANFLHFPPSLVVAAARNGITESEMEDLLSLDDDVLNDVYQYWTPPTRRLPPLLWVRVKNELEEYLVNR